MTPCRARQLPAMTAACLLGLVCVSSQAFAENATPDAASKTHFSPQFVPAGSVKIDGFVTDWEALDEQLFKTLTRGEPEYDWTGPKDLSMGVKMVYDREFLYVAVHVRDNKVTVRKGRKGGDAVEMWFDAGAVAGRDRLRMLRFTVGQLHDGKKPDVAWAYPRGLKGAPKGLSVEGVIRNDGWFFEAALPLSQLCRPAPGLEPMGIAFIARDWDYDDPNEDEAAVHSAPFDARRKKDIQTLGSFTLGGADAVKNGFFRSRPDAKGKKVVASIYADMAGDSRREYIYLVGHYVVVAGMGIDEGAFFFYELPRPGPMRLLSLEAREVTGDANDEVFVTWEYDSNVGGKKVTLKFLAGYQFVSGQLNLVFQQEIENRGPGWTITNRVSFKKHRGEGARIVVDRPKAKGVTEESYLDPDANINVDWERILLPWGDEKKATLTFDVSQFYKQ